MEIEMFNDVTSIQLNWTETEQLNAALQRVDDNVLGGASLLKRKLRSYVEGDADAMQAEAEEFALKFNEEAPIADFSENW